MSTVKSILGQVKLQKKIERKANWSILNKLKLNMDDCKVLSFGRSKLNSYEFQYKLFGHDIEVVKHMKNLGTIFESNFKFNEHLDNVVSRSFELLSFMKRSTKEFRDINAILNIY